MEPPSRILAELKPNLRYRPKDHTTLWSRISKRKHRYNRMDPDPEPLSDASPPVSRPNTKRDRDGKLKYSLTKDEWKRFWVERLRRLVDAPHLTDKDLSDAVDRSRRIFLRQRDEDRQAHIDPDIPPCFYWDKFEIANWVESTGLPKAVKEMFLHFGISGRHLVTLDANKLLKMGLYELGTIKAVTKAVRDILGLPHTNGLRAMARVPPLETFLKLKVRTGPISDRFTFKEFCEEQKIEYEPVKQQMKEGYQPIPGCCRVEIRPHPREDVKWIPIKVHKQNKRRLSSHYDLESNDSDLSKDSSEDSFLDEIPTVEELVNDVHLRNAFIPQILNDIVEAVFKKVSENKRKRRECLKNKQQVANEVVKDHLDKAYSDFQITDPEDKLKFVTIIAEELVEDVMRAREILEDIDKFQSKMTTEIPEEDMKDLQQAVAHYVQNIMPVVVSAALKEMEESSTLICQDGRDISSDSESHSSQHEIEQKEETEHQEPELEDAEYDADEFEVIWDRTFVDDYRPFSNDDDIL